MLKESARDKLRGIGLEISKEGNESDDQEMFMRKPEQVGSELLISNPCRISGPIGLCVPTQYRSRRFTAFVIDWPSFTELVLSLSDAFTCVRCFTIAPVLLRRCGKSNFAAREVMVTGQKSSCEILALKQGTSSVRCVWVCFRICPASRTKISPCHRLSASPMPELHSLVTSCGRGDWLIRSRLAKTRVWSSAGIKGRGKREIPEKNPPTNGIVRHDSHMRESRVTRSGIGLGSPWWEASRLTAQTPNEINVRVSAKVQLYTQFSDVVLGGVAVRLLASHPGEPGSIPGRAAPGSSYVGIVVDDAAGWRVSSGVSHLPLVSSEDVNVENRPNLFTRSNKLKIMPWKIINNDRKTDEILRPAPVEAGTSVTHTILPRLALR
ncbi:hypothetical protein PR048_030774 [Dryococelus australis]|uniref:Uncharacterized protein n=1 Tax=Dryococelus australis TaxID=614101 RepID=A0ABQ9GCJ2_9NEOP|nr:hypothetical protein PR048_030774 [Dryococelus australis]